MKCVICKGEDIKDKEVEEDIRSGNDIVLVHVRAMVCSSCGERYYDKRTMKILEEMEDKIANKIETKFFAVKTVGRVLEVSGI